MKFRKILFKIRNSKIIKYFIHKNRFLIRTFFEFKYIKKDPYLTTIDEKEIIKLEKSFDLVKDSRYKNILDIGCGEGYLVEKLIPLADRIVALDISKLALQRAEKRIRKDAHIDFIQKDILKYKPGENFDLIICSEILYYLQLEDVKTIAGKLIEWISPNGKLLLVNVYSKTERENGVSLKSFGAKTIHQIFMKKPELRLIKNEQYHFFGLTLFKKIPQERN